MTVSAPARSGKTTQLAVLALLAGSGLAAGYLIPWNAGLPVQEAGRDSASSTAVPTTTVPEFRGGTTHRFRLSPLDVRDHNQSPQVVSDGAMTVWLAWDSRTDEGTFSLFLTRSDDGGQTFREPRIVRQVPIREWEVPSRGNVMIRSSRLWPRLAWAEGTLYLNWLGPVADDPEQLMLFVSRSTDAGETFDEPTPLSSPIAARRGYPGFAAASAGRVAACWLDSRNGSQQPFASLLVDGQLDEQLVFAGQDDRGICPCCTLATLIGDDGTQYVAFRNQIDGYRDMWLSVRPAGQSEFEPPLPIAGDRWTFDGCPHDGPSLAIQDGVLHVAWMDAHTGVERVYHARSPLGARDFRVQPISPGTPGTQGHPLLHVGRDGALHVVWDESRDPPAGHSTHGTHAGDHGTPAGSGRAIYHSVSRDGGRSFSTPRAVQPVSEVFQTRPGIVAVGDRALAVAWSELSEFGRQTVLHAIPGSDE